MKIKAVCELTGLSDRAVRFYIDEGLLAPQYTEGYLGRKAFTFSDADVAMLKDIATLRKFGFSIPEIKEMQTDANRILPLVRSLQQRKKQLLADEGLLLQSLLSIEDGQSYTVSKLAAILSAPAESKALPAEDNASHLRKTMEKIILFLFAGLLPGINLFTGLHFLFREGDLNTAATVSFYILTPLTLFLLGYFIFSHRKENFKIIACSITIACFLITDLFLSVCSEYVLVKNYEGAHSEALYTASEEAYPLLPDLRDTGDYVSLEYYQVHWESSLFASETLCYIFDYSREEYLLQKEALEQNYLFQSAPIIEYDGFTEPMVEIDGYTFRFLSREDYEKDLYYPKEVMLIAYSDQAQEIVYMLHEDPDLDYIGNAEHFIKHSCGWIYMNR